MLVDKLKNEELFDVSHQKNGDLRIWTAKLETLLVFSKLKVVISTKYFWPAMELKTKKWTNLPSLFNWSRVKFTSCMTSFPKIGYNLNLKKELMKMQKEEEEQVLVEIYNSFRWIKFYRDILVRSWNFHIFDFSRTFLLNHAIR